MKTLIEPQPKLDISSFNNKTNYVKAEWIHSKSILALRFYQRLFVLFLLISTFLILPESPKESENICKKYNSREICQVW